MKTLEEFKEFYQRELLPDITELEQQRKTTVSRVISVIIPLILITLAAVIFLPGDAKQFALFGGIGLVVVVFIGLTRQFVNDFKERVIRKIILFFDKGFRYRKEDYIPQAIFNSSTIFRKQPDAYSGEDRVTGIIGVTQIDFSEVKAQTVTRDSKGRKHYSTFFKGLFFIADFNKDFHTTTYVLPDTAERLFGGFGSFFQKRNMSRPDLVKLEDPEFEKLFVVYGEDQVESRYILSTSLMHRIVEYQKKTGRDLSISFRHSKMYVAIPYTKNLLEPKLFTTLLNFKVIQTYYDDLHLFLGIVEDLNLNTRIWSKQ